MSEKWRDAVVKAMQKAAEAEAAGSSSSAVLANNRFVRSTLGYNYRWEHVTSVVTLAIKLANILDADENVVEAAAWLHDITKTDGEEHAETAAEFARVFLEETDFPREKIEDVAQAISDHKGLWRERPLTNLSSMILWDADKLSKLGLTAVVHWTGLVLSRHEPVTTGSLIGLKQNLEWQRRSVDSLHTQPAREAAKIRMDSYEQFWTNLEIELAGDDILPDLQ